MQKSKKPILPIIIDVEDFDSSISLRNFFFKYLEDVSPRLKQSTVDCKVRVVRDYVLPYLGDLSLNEITPQHIRTWQNILLAQFDFSTAYIALIDRHCASIFNYAKQYYDLPSPFDKTGHVKILSNHSMTIWSVEDFQTFITYFNNDLQLKTLYEVLYWNGLRIGEALALTPEDINRNPLELRICKALSSTSSGDIISTPKTKKSNRRISLPSFIYEDLMQLIKSQNIKMKSRIFEMSRTCVRSHMLKACESTGVKPIRIHDLRHSHVSLLIQMGYSPVLIAERVGHEKVSTTLNTYAHLFPSQQAMIASSLDRVNSLGVTPCNAGKLEFS